MARSFNLRFVLWLVLALVVGFAAGFLFRRNHDPSVEERIEEAAKELQKGVRGATEKLTR
jgi:uncharacterized membrane-anchored protein YhcB (DUF1043 family)